MGQVGQRNPEYRDIWDDYNHRQEFEHDLINRKTTWWLTTQTILFAAYGVTLREIPLALAVDAASFRKVISIVGLAVALVTFIGVSAVIISKYLSWRDYKRFYESKKSSLPGPLAGKTLQWGVNTPNTWVTLTPDLLLPIIFFGAWLLVVTQPKWLTG